MKLIKPGYIIESDIDEEKTLRHLENVGRTCYRSEHKMGDFNSTKKFIKALITSGHEAIIEHSLISVRFIIDRGISHELVRHRLCSFSQESTRYCNYSDDKYDKDITCIIPFWSNLEEGTYKIENSIDEKDDNITILRNNVPITLYQTDYIWVRSLCIAEQTYMDLLENQWSAEKARSVLPSALKTEIVVSANLREWRHIFKLRVIGSTGKPHPQIKEVMLPLLNDLWSKLPIIFDDLHTKYYTV